MANEKEYEVVIGADNGTVFMDEVRNVEVDGKTGDVTLSWRPPASPTWREETFAAKDIVYLRVPKDEDKDGQAIIRMRHATFFNADKPRKGYRVDEVAGGILKLASQNDYEYFHRDFGRSTEILGKLESKKERRERRSSKK